MNILNGIQNFLKFINDNWTMIIGIVTLIIVIAHKIKSYIGMSKEERINIAKVQIREIMLMLVTQAECDYLEWVSAGSIKRSQVIDEIFEMFPVLSTITNQKEIIDWIDMIIDESLEEMRKIFEENRDEEPLVTESVE